MKGLEELKQHMKKESIYIPPVEVVDEFLAFCEEVKYDPNDSVIDFGECTPYVFVLKEGVLSKSVVHDGQEIILSFADPGTMIFSYHSFLINEPSCIRVAACCKSSVLRISHDKVRQMINGRQEFALWLLGLSQHQLMDYDTNSSIVQGDALSRYQRLLRVRPDIIKYVPLKMIASYLGITQQHLSRIRSIK